MNLEPVIDDAVLLDGLRRGDDHAFTTLVRQHGGRMLATARRLLRDDDEAEDAVQEAFVSAARAMGGFAGDSKLSTWLHRVVVNTALMRLRSRRRRREEPIERAVSSVSISSMSRSRMTVRYCSGRWSMHRRTISRVWRRSRRTSLGVSQPTTALA